MIRIGIDFDNTIAGLTAPWLDRINRFHGTNFPISAWDSWDAGKLPAHIRSTIHDFISPDIYQDVRPYEGARDAIQKFMDNGFSVLCVTANPPFLRDEFESAKRAWLQNHLPELGEKVLFQDDKSQAPIDILIDDKPENLQGPFVPIIFDQPWNRSFSCPFRISSWDNAEYIIQSALEKI